MTSLIGKKISKKKKSTIENFYFIFRFFTAVDEALLEKEGKKKWKKSSLTAVGFEPTPFLTGA